MLRSLFLPLLAIVALTLTGVGCEDSDSSATRLPQLDIGDGSMVTANGVLRAVHSLAAIHDVTILFHQGNHPRRSIVAWSQETVNQFPGDQPYVHISDKHFSMNDQVKTLEELSSRLQRYAQAAKLTGSPPVMLVGAEVSASGERLVTLFHELSEAGITMIVALP